MNTNQLQLLVPNKIKVGFQNRDDTYTKKLAYVIYFDLKGKLRKQTSWESWRNEKIDPVEYDNVPTEGFVLNKGVGGARHSYGWNSRNEYIRVYDPRDFEFEISVANLLFILRECDCSKGKGLEGKFVYAWHGTELVLLPEASADYQNSKQYTQLQGCRIKMRDLVPGVAYMTKRQEVWIYLGKLNKSSAFNDNVEVKHVFRNQTKVKTYYNDTYEFVDNVNKIAVQHSDSVVSNYAELLDEYNASMYGSRPMELFLKPRRKASSNSYDRSRAFCYEDGYVQYETCHAYDENGKQFSYMEGYRKVYIKNKTLSWENCDIAYCPDEQSKSVMSKMKQSRRHWTLIDSVISDRPIKFTNDELWVRMESGVEYKLDYNSLISE